MLVAAGELRFEEAAPCETFSTPYSVRDDSSLDELTLMPDR